MILLFVLFKNVETRKKSPLLLIAMALFIVWAMIDVYLWATNKSYLSIFWWSIQILVEPIIYILSAGVMYNFLREKIPSFKYFFLGFIVLLPLIIFLPTDLTLYEVNLFDCIASESSWIIYYTYFIEILSVLLILLISVYAIYFKKNTVRKNSESILFMLGLIAFLIAFTSGNVIGSLTEDWVTAQYGLFGLPVFIGVLGYLIVKFKTYSLNTFAAQVLIIALVGLVSSLTLVSETAATRNVSVVTLLLTLVLGTILIRSVKKEIRQKEQLERLTIDLAKANKRLKKLDKLKSEFVSIASHQLRSPLTSIRGYASMLAEESFGKLPQKAKEPVERIVESSQRMAGAIEDYLNVSRIESGNMKYNLSDFNLKDEVEKITDDVRAEAMKKGLVLLFRSKLNCEGIVNADIGKTVQIVHNLINNSIKYTPKGSITVLVRDDLVKKKIFVDIVDTGIGMSQETIDHIFEKFERADNANSVNVSGTGLGLFVALKMANAMKGDITAESEGDGKGSVFSFELPLIQ